MRPIISETDYNTIHTLIHHLPAAHRTKEIGQLQTELNNALRVPDEKISDAVIRLNSYFEVEELTSGKILKLWLVMPKLANISNQKISILSPLGVALIGFKEGMLIDWVLPGGPKKLKILKVSNENPVAEN
jgi:regulator of nucleoside diphosphate kinase